MKISAKDWLRKKRKQILSVDGVEGVGTTNDRGEVALLVMYSGEVIPDLKDIVPNYISVIYRKTEPTELFLPQNSE